MISKFKKLSLNQYIWFALAIILLIAGLLVVKNNTNYKTIYEEQIVLWSACITFFIGFAFITFFKLMLVLEQHWKWYRVFTYLPMKKIEKEQTIFKEVIFSDFTKALIAFLFLFVPLLFSYVGFLYGESILNPENGVIIPLDFATNLKNAYAQQHILTFIIGYGLAWAMYLYTIVLGCYSVFWIIFILFKKFNKAKKTN
ncbi:hypothetical protein [Mycoplasmopsis iners]|uniref:hypothetical protein n=1 Tax=Mycoplasmopsis iners TaxID=76630 RepID=UPI000495038B|nr:hypothetical protein [Mycoplasmopsis iners]